jgi:large subunit ribosomal protein L13
MVKEGELKPGWILVDAAGKPAGRLAVSIANALRGKDKPTFTPHVAAGDFVVVVNAGKVRLTGAKEDLKLYKNYSGFPGGLKVRSAAVIRRKDPTRIITQAVKGMLPRNKLSRTLMTRLKVYAGPDHPHAAQKPQPAGV